jgi:radical SAM superfamily enzyme YgiQ (UPF0313 family)
MLHEAGLTSCYVSLQSGSERIQKQVFDRPYDRELFLKTIRLCRSLGVVFYTDVITFNPYEEESDLQKTLDVLLEMKGPYGLCINKLFVLPGTPLAEQMRRDGKQIEDGGRDRLFRCYCRLFSIASLRPRAALVVRFLSRISLLRRYPGLIHVAAIDFPFRAAYAVRRCVSRLIPNPSASGPSARN